MVPGVAANIWRTGGADLGDAHRDRRPASVGRGTTFPARAQLLHPPAGPRGPAVGDLPRLASRRQPRRTHRRDPVRAARLPRDSRSVDRLRRLGWHCDCHRSSRRGRTRRHCDRRPGRRPAQRTRPLQPGTCRACGRVVPRARRVRSAVPTRHRRRRAHRLPRRPHSPCADRTPCGARGRRIRRTCGGTVHRRRRTAPVHRILAGTCALIGAILDLMF